MRLSYALAITCIGYCACALVAGPDPNLLAIGVLLAAMLSGCVALWFWERSIRQRD